MPLGIINISGFLRYGRVGVGEDCLFFIIRIASEREPPIVYPLAVDAVCVSCVSYLFDVQTISNAKAMQVRVDSA
jgi:hypothetical protein